MFRKTNNSWLKFRKAPEGEGGAAGAGGGATSSGSGTSSSDTGSTAAPAPAGSGVNENIGGARQQPASHGMGEVFSSPETNARVGEILNRGGDAKISSAEINDLLNFNVPFLPAAPKANETAPANPAATPPASAQPAAPAAPTEANPAPAQPAAAAPLTAEAIAAAVKAAVTSTPAATPTNTPPAPERRPFYGEGGMSPPMAINPELTAAIFNTENPQLAQQGLTVLVNGMMNKIMEDSGQLMAALHGDIMKRVQEQVLPQYFTSQTQIRDNTQKFYGKFQELNVPTLKPLIQAVAAAMRQAEPNADPGSDDFLGRLGLGVHAAFKQQFGVEIPRKGAPAVAAPVVTTTPAPAPREPFMSTGGARPPAGPLNGHDQSGDVLSFLI